MTPEYPEQLYKKLLSELDRIQNLQLPEDKTIEQCFITCTFQEQILMDWVGQFKFDEEEDEIYFFKTTRPKFSSHIHFFKKRYKAVLFQPQEQKERVAFFEYELDKLEKFLSENAGFYQYWKSGETSNDREYFTRAGNEDAGYDRLIASFQGLEMYKNFVQKQL